MHLIALIGCFDRALSESSGAVYESRAVRPQDVTRSKVVYR
jgi:hypothetical protein